MTVTLLDQYLRRHVKVLEGSACVYLELEAGSVMNAALAITASPLLDVVVSGIYVHPIQGLTNQSIQIQRSKL